MKDNSRALDLIRRIQGETKLLEDESNQINDASKQRYTKEEIALILDFLSELFPLIVKYIKK